VLIQFLVLADRRMYRYGGIIGVKQLRRGGRVRGRVVEEAGLRLRSVHLGWL
jgi:hypothetical protein